MSHWFNIKVKTIFVCIIYLTLLYTCYGVFYGDVTVSNFRLNVIIPNFEDVVVSDVTVDYEENDSLEEGVFGFLIGWGIAVGLTVLAVVTLGASIPWSVAIGGSIVTGLIVGGVSAGASSAGYSLGFSELVDYIKITMGTVIGFVQFLFGFLAFNLFGLAGDSYLVNVVLLFMAAPVWIYFGVIITGFVVEAGKAIGILMVFCLELMLWKKKL